MDFQKYAMVRAKVITIAPDFLFGMIRPAAEHDAVRMFRVIDNELPPTAQLMGIAVDPSFSGTATVKLVIHDDSFPLVPLNHVPEISPSLSDCRKELRQVQHFDRLLSAARQLLAAIEASQIPTGFPGTFKPIQTLLQAVDSYHREQELDLATRVYYTATDLFVSTIAARQVAMCQDNRVAHGLMRELGVFLDNWCRRWEEQPGGTYEQKPGGRNDGD